jgi:hypothetical protein
MAKSMMDNGKMVERMEAECGKVSMDNPISDNGKMER